jgi:hypothetical protein
MSESGSSSACSLRHCLGSPACSTPLPVFHSRNSSGCPAKLRSGVFRASNKASPTERRSPLFPTAFARPPSCATSPLHSGIRHTGGADDLVRDAAELVVTFLGASNDALSLSLVCARWADVVRSSDVWLPVLHAIAPFSSMAIRAAHADSRAAGHFSSSADWVACLTEARMGQTRLVSTRGVPASPQPKGLTGGWWSWATSAIRRPEPRRCIVTGCCCSGKGTFGQQLQRTFPSATPQRRGYGYADLTIDGWSFIMTEVVSVAKLRPMLRHFLNEAHGFVIVVDAANPKAVDDLRDELRLWVLEVSRDAPICFVINKLDRPGALSCEAAIARLGLASLGMDAFTALGRRHWQWDEGHDPTQGSAPIRRHAAVIGTCLVDEAYGASCVADVVRWLSIAADASTASRAN